MSQPDAAMMAPVQRVVRFMRTLDVDGLADAFTPYPAIVENFAPYLFRGEDAVERWKAAFVARVRALDLANLAASFGHAQDFSRSGDRVFFSLPTVWTGTAGGTAFRETGGWAFVLDGADGAWRIRSYAWAVTGYGEG
ncbi:MAG: hypothetical protein ABIO39_00780 [Caulobacteraceae bacterium]